MANWSEPSWADDGTRVIRYRSWRWRFENYWRYWLTRWFRTGKVVPDDTRYHLLFFLFFDFTVLHMKAMTKVSLTLFGFSIQISYHYRGVPIEALQSPLWTWYVENEWGKEDHGKGLFNVFAKREQKNKLNYREEHERRDAHIKHVFGITLFGIGFRVIRWESLWGREEDS